MAGEMLTVLRVVVESWWDVGADLASGDSHLKQVLSAPATAVGSSSCPWGSVGGSWSPLQPLPR